MKVTPKINIAFEGTKLSSRQLQALLAVAETHSQNQAAGKMGISVPVLHRYIKEAEQKVGTELISSTPRGSELTGIGERIIQTYKRYDRRLVDRDRLTLACTPITQYLAFKAVENLEKGGTKVDIIIGNDELNLHYIDLELVDLAIFDDPIYIYKEKDMFPVRDVAEVVKDTLIHVFKGKDYLRYNFGAQRIGFRGLEVSGSEYAIRENTSSLDRLLNSNYSFFINRSLALMNELDLESQTDSSLYKHSIFAVKTGDGGGVELLLQELKEGKKYFF